MSGLRMAGRASPGRRRQSIAWYIPSSGSIEFCDLRDRRGDVAVAVRLHEVTVGDARRREIRTDKYIDPVVMLPHLADLHAEQVARLAEGVEDLFAEQRLQVIVRVLRDRILEFA